jgi:molybdenum cofactor cytidylyltransferase
MIAGIFLAAGQSTRFGSNKLLHDLDGRPLVEYGLQAAVDSRLDEIIVVVGSEASVLENAIRDVAGARDKTRIVKNNHPERGMMSSLKLGLRALQPACDAAMVILADMPYVTSGLIDRLIEVFEEKDGIIIPECEGTLYHPRVIPKRLFPEFLGLEDTGSGQSIIDRHRENIVVLKTEKKTRFIDVDEPRDLER